MCNCISEMEQQGRSKADLCETVKKFLNPAHSPDPETRHERHPGDGKEKKDEAREKEEY